MRVDFVRLNYWIITLGLFFGVGCDQQSPRAIPAEISFEVKAGSNQEVMGGSRAQLVSFIMNPLKKTLAYQWIQTSGFTVKINDDQAPQATFMAPETGLPLALNFRISVTDETGLTKRDSMSITVLSRDNNSVSDADVDIDLPPANSPPRIVSVQTPPQRFGEMTLLVAHQDEEQDVVRFQIDFSNDSGNTWQGATITQAVDGFVVAAPNGDTEIQWQSLSDIGFHNVQTVLLRITPLDDQAGESVIEELAGMDNLQEALQRVDYYTIYYQKLSEQVITYLENYQLAILHPEFALTAAQVADVKDGKDPINPGDDVIVLCYISAGEDARTVLLSDEQMLDDPRFTASASQLSGPRVDPRGETAYVERVSLSGIDPLGLPSPGGAQYASWYLDDVSLASGNPDGLPDRNRSFGGAYVNVGDPAWYDVLNEMNSQNGEPTGIQQVLAPASAQGLGCDGVFLDTIDVAQPNLFGDTSKYEWVAPGVKAFLSKLRNDYPRALIAQNRGLFFFSPDYPHYQFSTRDKIDILLFESFRLDSLPANNYIESNYCINKRYFAPKIMAEAIRPNGFKVFSLGYAEGPENLATQETLLDTLQGESQFGFEELLKDTNETQDLFGFRHFISNAKIGILNDFVKQRSSLNDNQAPIWSSTYNNIPCGQDENSDLMPTPRVGVQQVVRSENSALLRWDVALDMNLVTYVAYYQDRPFDFTDSTPLGNATRVKLVPELGQKYQQKSGENTYPFEATIDGLDDQLPYYFLIRAVDNSMAAYEDDNQAVLIAMPLL